MIMQNENQEMKDKCVRYLIDYYLSAKSVISNSKVGFVSG
jgi:hypothetical protein